MVDYIAKRFICPQTFSLLTGGRPPSRRVAGLLTRSLPLGSTL